ncbi:cerebellin-3-like isoform X2 [Crassostrea angulata]|uniref:cerebellin-3-like isoform X2 n=1 Tax=Magallana angulata TaxID=2784310 RepID=UPI0022B09F36|nr:cerebellin-3-like isoform X2 [Crassostrea angulata]
MKEASGIVIIFCFVCVVCIVSSTHGEQIKTKIVQRKSQDDTYHILHMIANLQREMKDVQRTMKERQKHIAFTALQDETGQRITHPSQVVKYNQVLLNIGGGYQKHSGHFVAPVDGTYVFFLSLLPTPGTSASFFIFVNSRSTVEALNVSSNMAIVSLSKGDHVWVMSHPGGRVDPRQRLQYAGNTFSGFLVYQK